MGSETTTSKSSRERSRWLRASANTIRKRGSSFTRPPRSGKKRVASQVAFSISTHSSDSSGWRAAEAAVAPAPQPTTSARRGERCSSSGTCAISFCVTTSSTPLPASVLPFTDRKRRWLPRGSETATTASAPSR